MCYCCRPAQLPPTPSSRQLTVSRVSCLPALQLGAQLCWPAELQIICPLLGICLHSLHNEVGGHAVASWVMPCCSCLDPCWSPLLIWSPLHTHLQRCPLDSAMRGLLLIARPALDRLACGVSGVRILNRLQASNRQPSASPAAGLTHPSRCVILCSLALIGFIVMHLRLIAVNQTTIEAFEKRPIR